MAFDLRASWQQENNQGITQRIEIRKDASPQAALTLEANSDGFTFQHDRIDSSGSEGLVNIYGNQIQKGKLTFYPKIVTDDEQVLLDDILGAEERSYKLIWKQDQVTEWIGYIDTNNIEFKETGGMYFAKIRATDLDHLKGKPYGLQDKRTTFISSIADILSDLELDLDIVTNTSWIEENIDSSKDFLQQIYLNRRALRNYSQAEDEEDESISKWDALSHLTDPTLIVRQIGGVWRVEQLSAFSDPTSVRQTRYNPDGTQKVETRTVDRTQKVHTTADNGSPVLKTSSRNKGFPGLKEVLGEYKHATESSTIKPFEGTTITGEGEESRGMIFVSDGTQTMSLHFVCEADISASPADVWTNLEIKIEATDATYYLQDDYTWGTDVNTIQETMREVETKGSGFKYIGHITEETDLIPDAADGDLTMTAREAKVESKDTQFAPPNPTVNETQWNGRINISNSLQDKSEFIRYSLVQEGEYYKVFGYRQGIFGDGPSKYANGALRYSENEEDTTLNSWQRAGSTDYRNFWSNVLHEILDAQRDWTRIIEGELWGKYSPEDAADYDGNYYYYLGGRFVGMPGRWSPSMMRINIAGDAGDEFDDISKRVSLYSGAAGGTASATQGVAVRQTQLLEAISVMRTTSQLSGSISEVPVERLSRQSIRANSDFVLYHPLTLERQTLTAGADVNEGDEVITLDESTDLDLTFPQGSYVYLTGADLSAGIIQGQTATEIFAELNAAAEITQDISDTFDSSNEIPVKGPYVKLFEGWELTVFDPEKSQRWNITVDVDTEPYAGSIPVGNPDGEFINAGSGSYVILPNLSVASFLHVDPGRVQIGVDSEREGNALGLVDETIASGATITSVDLVSGLSAKVKDGDTIILENRFGGIDELTVDGDQGKNTDPVSVVSTTVDNNHSPQTSPNRSHIKEPSYHQSNRISVNLEEILLKAPSVLVDADIFRTDSWGGEIDGDGNITQFHEDKVSNPGPAWARTGQAHFEITTGTKHFRFNGGGFEYKGDVVADNLTAHQVSQADLFIYDSVLIDSTTDDDYYAIVENINTNNKYAVIDLTNNQTQGVGQFIRIDQEPQDSNGNALDIIGVIYENVGQKTQLQSFFTVEAKQQGFTLNFAHSSDFESDIIHVTDGQNTSLSSGDIMPRNAGFNYDSDQWMEGLANSNKQLTPVTGARLFFTGNQFDFKVVSTTNGLATEGYVDDEIDTRRKSEGRRLKNHVHPSGHTWWQVRPAYYYNGFTYVSLVEEDGANMAAKVKKYNHATEQWTEGATIRSGFSIDRPDDHIVPALIVLENQGNSDDGTILLAFTHTNGMEVYTSDSTEDISSFTLQHTTPNGDDDIDPSLEEMENGKIFLFHRTLDDNVDFITSTDAGDTWSSATDFIDTGNVYYSTYSQGSYIHVIMNDQSSGTELDIYYMRSTDNGDSWETIGGTSITLPAGTSDMDQVFDSGSTRTRHQDIMADPDQNPHLLSIYDAGSGNKVRFHYHDGSNWQFEEIGESAQINGSGVTGFSGFEYARTGRVYISETSGSNLEICRYDRLATGLWRKTDQITNEAGGDVYEPCPVVNALEPFTLIYNYSEGYVNRDDWGSNSRLFMHLRDTGFLG